MKISATPSDRFLATLRTLVELESPSHDKAATDKCGAYLRQLFTSAGGQVATHKQAKFGDHLKIEFAGQNADQKPIMLLGHFDTVWGAGMLTKMPCKIENGRIWGPGVYDMKCGIVMMLEAVRAVQEKRGGLPRPVILWLVTDEEVGSESSRAMTEQIAKQCAAVLVLEPAQGITGALKTARKGVGEFTVRVTGISSHAGVDFEKGQSAIVELARQIQKIAGFVDRKRGITVNPGVIRGGTRTNVIADRAEVECDLRIARMKDAAYLEKKFRSLKPFNRKCKLEISGGVNRPPMERGKGTVALFKMAQAIAKDLGFKVEEKSTGGGSDGNFTAGLGIPTLDGLGAVGEGAHALHESVLLEHIPRRTALLAGLLERI